MRKEIFLKAFRRLDGYLEKPVHILVGGGAAMLLGHNIPLVTMDVDGLLTQTELTPAELDSLVKKVAGDLKINPHWFNSYFSTFTYTIPPDFKKRLVPILKGKRLIVSAFGIEDLLIMKCFSGREKDIGHARALVRRGADLKIVEDHIERLVEKNIPGAEKAMDFLDDIRDQAGR